MALHIPRSLDLQDRNLNIYLIRLPGHLQESQDSAMSVFRRLPIDQNHIRLIHLKECSLRFVQGARWTDRFIVFE